MKNTGFCLTCPQLQMNTIDVVIVDDFRSLSLQLVQSHFRTAIEQGRVNRIEVLPISWHATLHGEDTGIDRKLKSITLNSIPKLRHFTNDTLLDILFYTSPVYCQVKFFSIYMTFVTFNLWIRKNRGPMLWPLICTFGKAWITSGV